MYGCFLVEYAVTGFELGTSNQRLRIRQRRKNSPVDCFVGGSREANPVTSSASKQG